MANCIGFDFESFVLLAVLKEGTRHRNYKHFVFFIAFTFFGCFYVAATSGYCMFAMSKEWAMLEDSARTSVISVFVVGKQLALIVFRVEQKKTKKNRSFLGVHFVLAAVLECVLVFDSSDNGGVLL